MAGRWSIQLIAPLSSKSTGRLRGKSIHIEIFRHAWMSKMRGAQVVGTIGGARARAGIAYIAGVQYRVRQSGGPHCGHVGLPSVQSEASGPARILSKWKIVKQGGDGALAHIEAAVSVIDG